MGKGGAADEVPVADIMPCFAFCCCMQSCYCKTPNCWGCYVNETFLCLEAEFQGCKPSDEQGKENKECCVLLSGQCKCVEVTTCCKAVNNCCCLDCRFALPCDKDVPAVCGLFFIICYPKCLCAKPYSDIASDAPVGGAPVGEQIIRE